jgi:hypothetical protein
MLASTTRMFGSLNNSESKAFKDVTSCFHNHKNAIPLIYTILNFINPYQVTSAAKAANGDLFFNSFEA